MSYAIDHLVILVQDLEHASASYTAQGYRVVPGGEHTDGATRNALIAFADGSYLELIAFQRAAPRHRWWRFVGRSDGLIDWAWLPSGIAADISAARAAGVVYRGPSEGGRLRPDGQAIRWQTGLPPTTSLPFFCADLTPRDLRVPSGEDQRHDNGARGLAEVVVGVANLDVAVRQYQALLGCPPSTPAHDGRVRFALGSTTVALAGPGEASVRRQLAARGPGPHSFTVWPA